MKAICLDFDGVVHSYTSGWKGAEVIPDPPVEGAIEFITECIENGVKVHIFSARSHQGEAIEAMKNFLLKYGLRRSYLDKIGFPQHKPQATIYIDDRGFHFEGKFPTLDYVNSFKPWNKK